MAHFQNELHRLPVVTPSANRHRASNTYRLGTFTSVRGLNSLFQRSCHNSLSPTLEAWPSANTTLMLQSCRFMQTRHIISDVELLEVIRFGGMVSVSLGHASTQALSQKTGTSALLLTIGTRQQADSDSWYVHPRAANWYTQRLLVP